MQHHFSSAEKTEKCKIACPRYEQVPSSLLFQGEEMRIWIAHPATYGCKPASAITSCSECRAAMPTQLGAR
ncbi:hypothetical protein OPV22_022441 [Ensete ventricosum]|uniref:Uncharacterized protein n=1 Tax=Ensete ventricosum TaxID=4639 RepID=A0AAV8QFM0_ENSVE|nr:hypothetical protein OPV22_022441 [Ensete ventricosum]